MASISARVGPTGALPVVTGGPHVTLLRSVIEHAARFAIKVRCSGPSLVSVVDREVVLVVAASTTLPFCM